jgi:hypothetical protein
MLLQPTIQAAASQENEGWKWLWKIQVPPKAKHLIWRICKGCLLTRKRLQERYVQCPLSCPYCENNEENDWNFRYECEGTSTTIWHKNNLQYSYIRGTLISCILFLAHFLYLHQQLLFPCFAN